MKKTTTTTLHDGIEFNNSAARSKAGKATVWKVGLDVDLRQIAVAMQCGRGAISLGRKYWREQLLGWVKQKIRQGHSIYTVYECCGFGYTLHEELMQKEELKVIRIPSRSEQQRRELGRQRDFWKRELRRLENHGRALPIEHEYETLERGWAGPRKWNRVAPQCSEFVREQLTPVVEQIRAVKKQLDRLTGQIEALVAEEKIPIGLGALTVSLLEGEVCDWRRFINRKAVGSYTGCCPSEHSSGGIQRFGSIDRHGNKHVRTLLVEAVWRLLKWQPNWHARQKYLQKLKVAASLKKKMAVALARQLAIDMWRWRTGRASAAELGFRVISARREMSGAN